MGTAPQTWVVDLEVATARETVPGVWQLRLPLPWSHAPHVNVYALSAPDGGVVLIDSGGAGDASARLALERGLGAAGRSLDEVADIVITHPHSDHVGSAGHIKRRTGCRIWMPPGAAYAHDVIRRPEQLASILAERALRGGVPRERLHRFTDMSEELEGIEWPLPVDRALVPGIEVPTSLGPLTVIDTPGHAPAHVALYEPRRRLLFSGDLFMAAYAGAFDFGYVDDPIAQWLRSLTLAEALGATASLPGHGRPIDDTATALDRNRQGMVDRLGAIEARMAARPRSAYGLLVELMPEAIGSDTESWRFDETLSYLRHLERGGRIKGAVGSDGVERYCSRTDRSQRCPAAHSHM